MSKEERRRKRTRFLSLILAVLLVVGSISVVGSSKSGKAEGVGGDANLSLYDAAGISYYARGSHQTVVYYNLYSIKEFPQKGYFEKGSTTEEVKAALPKTVTLVLNATGTYTRTAGINWTPKAEDPTDEKILFTGKVVLPYDVNNPNNVLIDYDYTAILTDKKIISNAQVSLKGGKTGNPNEFEYQAKQICPEVESLKLGNEIIDPKNYTVTYGENFEVGKGNGTVKIEAKEGSEYAGFILVTFDIVKAKQLKALYGSRNSFTYNPQKANDEGYSFNLFLNEIASDVSYTVSGSQNSNALQKISVDTTGKVTIPTGIADGEYTISVKATKRERFQNPQTTFVIRVGVAPADNGYKKTVPEDQGEVKYDLGVEEFYIVKADGTEEKCEIKDGIYYDYYDRETVVDDPYKICFGDDEKNSEFIIRKTNDTYQEMVLCGWYTDKEYKTKFKKDILENNEKTTLYACWKLPNSIKLEKSSYKKNFKGNVSFRLNAKAYTKIKYTSSDKKVCKVDSLGKVTILSPGKANITVKATATAKFDSAKKKVTVNVVVAPTTIIGIAKTDTGAKVTCKQVKTVANITGYEFQRCSSPKFSIGVSDRKPSGKKNYTNYSNTARKKYYYRVRSYVVRNGKHYSEWSATKASSY